LTTHDERAKPSEQVQPEQRFGSVQPARTELRETRFHGTVESEKSQQQQQQQQQPSPSPPSVELSDAKRWRWTVQDDSRGAGCPGRLQQQQQQQTGGDEEQQFSAELSSERDDEERRWFAR